jgi:hypothetical protein
MKRNHNQAYVLQGATNLIAPISWAQLGTVTSGPNGAITFTDLQASNYPARFYRISTS